MTNTPAYLAVAAIWAATSALVGCAAPSAVAAPAPSAPDRLAKLEPLLALTMNRENITVRVSTNGCTKKEDFTAKVAGPGDQPVLSLQRIKPDPCRSFRADGTDLSWTYDELGVASHTPLRVGNSFIAQ